MQFEGGNSISYLYAADGTKLRTTYKTGNEDIATYDNEPKYEVIQTDISNVAKIISDFTKV